MIEVKVREDGMLAEVSVCPEPEEELTEELIENNLRLEGVQAGIDKKAIASLLEKKIYNTFIAVASGKAPIDGIDGYFEYFFSTGDDLKRPRIREDGSADYTRFIINVNAGDLLAEYHPEKNGVFGYNVFAKTLAPYKGKPKRPLRCVNVREEEGKYYAEKNGHVALDYDTLTIQNVLEIHGDASYNGGDILFNGDVHVSGNINSGITVRASGSVIVDGVIEDAKVFAGKNVVVNQGIHGQGTHKDGVLQEEGSTMIEAKGSLHTKFIDHAFVRADGNVFLDYAVGSVITSEGMVVAQGSKGAIVGGRTSALLGIDANSIGNQTELSTEINVGMIENFADKVTVAKEHLQSLEEKLIQYKGKPEEEELLQMKEEAREQALMLEQKIRDRQIAPVIIRKALYPNVKMKFGSIGIPDMAGRFNVEFRKIGGRVLCKDIGHYTQEELVSGMVDTETQIVTEEKQGILVIDDDSRLLRTVYRILEADYQVAVATSGNAARKFLEKNEVELILLDYMMPDENGVEVLNSFRNWDKTRDLPVVFLTGLNDKKKILECLSLHPAGYIQKPVDSEQLLAKIHAILGDQ